MFSIAFNNKKDNNMIEKNLEKDQMEFSKSVVRVFFYFSNIAYDL